MIRNGRVAGAGLMLVLTSALLATSATRSDRALPIGILATLMIILAVVALVRGSRARPEAI